MSNFSNPLFLFLAFLIVHRFSRRQSFDRFRIKANTLLPKKGKKRKKKKTVKAGDV